MRQPLERLASSLGYQFSSPDLFQCALTHRSASALNNERLEFLGDAVLNLVISTDLYGRFPQENEGRLSRLRANLVKGETLAEIARALELGDYILLGGGELRTGGHQRKSILADALEAIIGAVYLDGGMEPARDLILRLYAERIANAGKVTHLKDPKTRLQEALQARQRELPLYEVVQVVGEPHAQTFTVQCTIAGVSQQFVAEGSSRRKAEQAAADKALVYLSTENQ